MRVLMVGTKKIRGAGGMATHTEELIAHLRKLGVEVEHCLTSPAKEYDIVRDKLIRLYTRTLGLSFKLLKDSKKFDIVHIQASGPLGGFLPAIVGALWKKLLGFRLVVTFHYGQHESFLKRYKLFFSFVLQHTDMFLTVSLNQMDNIKKIFGDNTLQKIRLISNGFNSEIFYPQKKYICRDQLGLPKNKKIIINVANLVPVKGHTYLIEAMRSITKIRNDILCIIVGDGLLRNDLEKQIRQSGLENYIKLVGARPHDEIPLWMNAADLFVLPSLSEGNPTVMFEAMGCGLPFIGTRVGGVPEIITSDDYGLIAKPADARDLAEKILIALEKEWDREKIKEYAEQFRWENIAKQTLEAYMEVTRRLCK